MISNAANKVTISAILPVYNVEPWIGDCISSLKKQKQEGLEFIFVDDCSTDGSLAVIEDFAKEDNRVRILRNKENVGPGISRNIGIEAARGEYLSFIDPDDLVSDTFYEILYSKAKETGCDIVKGVRARFDDGATEEMSALNIDEVVNRRINLRTKTKNPLFSAFTCEHQTAIFKRLLFDDIIVRYGTSRNAQDVTFLLKICHRTESIVTTDKAVYYYRMRMGSATSDYTMKRSWNEMVAIEEIVEYLYDKPRNENYKVYLANRMRNFLSRYYYAVQSEYVTTAEQEYCLRRFRDVAGYFKSDKFLCMNYPELQIFKDFGFTIPYFRNRGDVVFKDGIMRWTDFFLTHTGPRESWQYLGYANAFVRAYASYIRAAWFENELHGSSGIMRQLACMSNIDRIKVIRLLPLVLVSETIRRIRVIGRETCNHMKKTK